VARLDFKSMPDAELVAVYRDRLEQPAFAELVRRHREQVFRVALSILGSAYAAEAEEVAQETFVRVHHAVASFRGDAQFGSWIYRIAFNLAINLKKRARYRMPHVPEDAIGRAHGPSALQRLEMSERNRALMSCVEELPEIYQAAVRLHYWMGHGVDEVAELIGVPSGTVKSYLHRARHLLHEMLVEKGFSDV
jgi:RNA polymerase sigma-70 factor, ECF subfamily